MSNDNTNTWKEEEEKNRKRGMIIAGVIHAALLLLFLYLGLVSKFPPEIEGFSINFGMNDQGSGTLVSEVKNPVKEPTVEASTPPPPVVEPVVESTTPEIETQNVVESVAIPVEEEVVVPDPVEEVEPEPVEEPVVETPVEEVEVESTPEPVPEPEPEPVVNTEHTFSGMPSDNNNPNSEGITMGDGDQGVETGNPSSDNYEGDISYGLGNSGKGWALAGRSLLSKPEINDDSQKRGKVGIKIKVDRTGKVVSAIWDPKTSTTTDTYLVNKAKAEAMKYKFNADSKASEVAFGIIVIDFKLQ